MVTVQTFGLNGYEGWIPSSERILQIEEFTIEAFTKFVTGGETSDPLALGDKQASGPDWFCVNGETNGFLVIKK